MQGAEPAKPLVPRDGCVRRRGGREHEERGLAKLPLLKPVFRSLAEDTVVAGLADERDDSRVELLCSGLEALARAGEVPGTQIARAARRPPR